MPLEMKYFILKPKSKYKGDPYAHASRQAMDSYAASILRYDPELARSLFEWVDRERKRDEELPNQNKE